MGLEYQGIRGTTCGYKEQSLSALTSTTICHKNKPKSEAFSNFQLNNLLNLMPQKEKKTGIISSKFQGQFIE